MSRIDLASPPQSVNSPSPPTASIQVDAVTANRELLDVSGAKRTCFTWTPDLEKRLDELFAKKVKTAEIGRRLGFTKNAVCGKLFRRRRRLGHTQTPYTPPRDVFNGGGCLWSAPDAHPDDPDFHFCGAQTIPGQAWCLHHRERVYRRVVPDNLGTAQ